MAAQPAHGHRARLQIAVVVAKPIALVDQLEHRSFAILLEGASLVQPTLVVFVLFAEILTLARQMQSEDTACGKIVMLKRDFVQGAICDTPIVGVKYASVIN